METLAFIFIVSANLVLTGLMLHLYHGYDLLNLRVPPDSFTNPLE